MEEEEEEEEEEEGTVNCLREKGAPERAVAWPARFLEAAAESVERLRSGVAGRPEEDEEEEEEEEAAAERAAEEGREEE